MRGGAAAAGAASAAYSLGSLGQSGAAGVASGLGGVARAAGIGSHLAPQTRRRAAERQIQLLRWRQSRLRRDRRQLLHGHGRGHLVARAVTPLSR